MLTHRHVLAGIITVVLTVAVVTTAFAGGKRNGSRDDRSHHDEESSSRFRGAAVCDVPRDGHVQFVNGRSPFSGTSRGAYGHIFFPGGGTTVPPTSPSGSAQSRTDREGRVTPRAFCNPAEDYLFGVNGPKNGRRRSR